MAISTSSIMILNSTGISPNSNSKPMLSSLICTTPVTNNTTLTVQPIQRDAYENQWPDRLGRFRQFGGKFVPETLVQSLNELESAFRYLRHDEEFQNELHETLRDYVGRETPLYFAERLTDHYQGANGQGPQIYLKREDLNHTGAHTINNAVGQALLAKRVGKKRIVAETGSGQHGISTAAICARLGMECVIYMGADDMKKHADDVARMELLGAEVRAVRHGSPKLKDATADAIRDMVTNLESTYYILGSAVGPHPYPMMVREFQAVIGREVRKQAMEKWDRDPDVLIACVGGGSNAMGLFHEFIGNTKVRLIGVEAAGHGLDSGKHAASLARGEIGVFQGALSYLLQDDDGQVIRAHSMSSGFPVVLRSTFFFLSTNSSLEYPGVGPEHSYLKDSGRAEYHSITDHEALKAFKRISRLEGIIPALETSHALAFLDVIFPSLPNGTKVIVNCSGRGDKDLMTAMKCTEL